MILRRLSLFGACCVTVFLSACGSGGGGGGEVTVVTAPPVVRAALPLVLQTTVQDASTKLPLSLSATEKISVAVYGADADKIVDGDGKSLYTAANKFAGPLTSSDGIFTLYFKPAGAGPFTANVRIVATAKNYITSSQDLVISDKDLNRDGTVKSIQVPISLISLAANSQPESVVAAKVTAALSASGATTTPITATTPAATGTKQVDGVATTVALGAANVSIPTSVVAYSDANKTIPLPAGAISVDVVYNNNTTSSSLAAFPGGFASRQDPNGQALTTPGGFISGGFASIEVSSTAANGDVTKAKTFDKPISVTISLPKGTINPETGVPANTGDTIPLWSYDTTTGEWSPMKLVSTGAIITGKLGPLGADNTYPVTFITDHLSYFNLDWFFWKDQIPGKSTVLSCDVAPITITGAGGKPLFLLATMVGGGWSHDWRLDSTVDPAFEKITYAPKNLKMRIDAYFGTNQADPAKLVGSVTVDDLCLGVNLDVTAGVNRLSPSIRLATMDFTTREVCDTDSTKTQNVAGDTVYAVAAGFPNITAPTNSAGVASLTGLVVGQTYAVTVKNRDGQTSKSNIVISDTNQGRAVDFNVKCTTSTVTGATGRGS